MYKEQSGAIEFVLLEYREGGKPSPDQLPAQLYLTFIRGLLDPFQSYINYLNRCVKLPFRLSWIKCVRKNSLILNMIKLCLVC